ncbi:hypothetical protein HY469_01730 [Candidatus Roizmanbacteria bacterium]|nr:hypothetical protein [Candidatus Roizmanbacteria bacterium]
MPDFTEASVEVPVTDREQEPSERIDLETRPMQPEDIPAVVKMLGDVHALFTVQSDFNDVDGEDKWQARSQVDRLVEEMEKRGIHVHAISPRTSRYSVVNGISRAETIFEFQKRPQERQETNLFPIYDLAYEGDFGRFEEVMAKRPIFLPLNFDETLPGNIQRVDNWQSSFLEGIEDQSGVTINSIAAERYTLKNAFNTIARRARVPILPTSHFQDEEQLHKFTDEHVNVVRKRYNSAQGVDTYWIVKGSPITRSLIHSFSSDPRNYSDSLFQPKYAINHERQVYFIRGVPVGVIKKYGGDPWGIQERHEELDELRAEEIEYVERITRHTGLCVGRVDFVVLDEPIEGRTNWILEINGVGSGQIFWEEGKQGEPDILKADFTDQLVDYIIDNYPTKSKRKAVPCRSTRR